MDRTDAMAGAAPRLVIFDMDGTLIDSEALICGCMDAAFQAAGHPAPGAAATRRIVGLSLPIAIARLAPALDEAARAAVTARYKDAFTRVRAEVGDAAAAPMFPGARAALDRIAQGGALMAVATGKARRGLERVLDAHDLRGFFAATQSADDAPSKPHPGMVLNALAAAGGCAARAVVVGDSAYDVEMAVAAGVPAIGVSWGVHPAGALRDAGAAAIIDSFAALDGELARLGLAG